MNTSKLDSRVATPITATATKITGIAVLGALVTACSTSPTTQQGTHASSTGSASSAATAPAPKVAKPLDANAYLHRPCALLSTAQVRAIGLHEPQTPTPDPADAGSPGCTWGNNNSTDIIGMDFETTYPHGLANLYAEKTRRAYFQPTTINGYPAVNTTMTINAFDERPNGFCAIYVGVTNTQVLRVNDTAPDRKQASCATATKAAQQIITTLQTKR